MNDALSLITQSTNCMPAIIKEHMKRKHSTITILMVFAAFGFLYLMSKTESVSDQQYYLEDRLDDLEGQVEENH